MLQADVTLLPVLTCKQQHYIMVLCYMSVPNFKIKVTFCGLFYYSVYSDSVYLKKITIII